MEAITIRNAKIIYRNFSGRQNQYNPEGHRNFSVVIEDEDFAMSLLNEGWNVKPLRKLSDDSPQHYQLPVAVVYGKYPPTIRIITQSGGEVLDEETVNMLDWTDIIDCDMIIRPREYDIRGGHGVKAYVRSMNVRIHEDELASDYKEHMNQFAVNSDMPF